jgi:SAM-dependent methyltransferase
MKRIEDAYGQQLLAQYYGRNLTSEIIERDDGYIAAGSERGMYFSDYKQWSPRESHALKFVQGKTLDVGCGAGRHSLYLQQQGFDVTGIDISPGAIKVSKLRGLRKAMVRPISEIDKFRAGSFGTVLMLGNNFGLLGNAKGARRLLPKLSGVTSATARIIAGTRNPYKTTDANHLDYHRLNRSRGRMPGQIRMRVRFEKAIGAWFDYLLVSPEEMKEILRHSDWEIEELIAPAEANYFAILRKRCSE